MTERIRLDLKSEEAQFHLKPGKDLHWDYLIKEMKWLAERLPERATAARGEWKED